MDLTQNRLNERKRSPIAHVFVRCRLCKRLGGLRFRALKRHFQRNIEGGVTTFSCAYYRAPVCLRVLVLLLSSLGAVLLL